MEGFASEIDFLQRLPGSCSFVDGAFRCLFPGCNAKYRRKEHLHRHERSKHIMQQGLVCSTCGVEFRRRYPHTYSSPYITDPD